jgi:hypothetical protein
MEGYCSTGQSPPWAVVPVEEEEEEYFDVSEAVFFFREKREIILWIQTLKRRLSKMNTSNVTRFVIYCIAS